MIQQVTFEIPVEISKKLAIGEYVQYGGVVRDLRGRIVKHLRPVVMEEGTNAPKKLAARAIQLAKQNKRLAIGAIVVAGVVVAGGVICAGITYLRRQEEAEVRRSRMDAFNAAFSEYLRALGDEVLAVEKIDALEEAMAALGSDGDGFTVEIEGEQFKGLVRSIRSYTDRLSEANGGKDSNAGPVLFEKKTVDIADLRECLSIQRGILAQAA